MGNSIRPIHRHLLWFAAILFSGVSALAAESSDDAGPLRPTPVGKVSMTGGFWGPRVTLNATATLPHNLDFIEKSRRMEIFDRVSGAAPDSTVRDIGVGDSDVFKIIEGAAYTLQQRPDMVDPTTIDGFVKRIVAAQQDDGLLCPRVTIDHPDDPWKDLHKSHVLYSAGHLFEAGVAMRDATGDRKLFDASLRYADLIDRSFGPGKLHAVPGHQGIELALVRLHNAAGDSSYLDLSRFFLDQRGHIHGGTERVRGEKPRAADYMQDRVPLVEAEEAVGHAVRAGYTYAAMADIVRERNDPAYRKALDRLWRDVVWRKLYLTGSSASAQYYDEGYGDPYYLPNDTAYCETCSTISTVLWSHRMGLIHADASYADVLERGLYNGVLSGISLTGDRFFYTNPLASRGGKRRSESITPACCQSNLVRVIPQVGALAYATSADAVFVNLFVSGTATLEPDAGELVLQMDTEYPRDGRIRITVAKAPAKPVTLALRIPGWAREMPVPSDLYRFDQPVGETSSLTVAGEVIDLIAGGVMQNGYARVERAWKAGEVIELDLPMPVRRVLAHDKVAANRGRVALQRGPLVYCIESIDNEGLRTDAIVLPDDAVLKTEHRDDLLGGVVAVIAEARVAYEPAWGAPAASRPHRLTAVPYHTWANRGDGWMDVWLPRSVDTATPLPAPTAGAVALISSSAKRPVGAYAALNDRRSGPESRFRAMPRFILPDEPDGWIQYAWDEPRELSRASVYWAIDEPQKVYWGERIRGDLLKLPKSWRLLYQNGDEWRAVEIDGHYPIKPDQANEVRFQPVTTKALRLEIDLADAPCGIQEWAVD
ncbi:MAG TPA: beta-L-arabinofuranosidase domain-containing protein [Luteolibacter sp.]|nr:beta-L-arabinofuranosidase domain-containing protein [Luteolibacter sp.]